MTILVDSYLMIGENLVVQRPIDHLAMNYSKTALRFFADDPAAITIDRLASDMDASVRELQTHTENLRIFGELNQFAKLLQRFS